MPRMYHPDLGVEHEVPTDDAAAVFAESGWLPAPLPEPAEPGRAVEAVVYAPVKSKVKTTAKASPADAGPEGDD